MADQTNGVTLNENQRIRKEETLYDVLHRSVSMILPDASSTESAPLLQRIKISVSENGPRLGEASRNTGQTLLRWTRRGSPLRALLVISVMVAYLYAYISVSDRQCHYCWVGFFWVIWLGTRKSVGFAKQSLSKTGSVISAYSSAQHARID
ncbi:hypothetical protein Gohar_013206 [Gossypium harknessii]|uniref:Uncharacterized protein n=1 Tax=Gossypium harknessii TaxID=34285 RepID=A0A7J9GZA4_9ROSI|nr:hypothetical protein [Gossypium harknessii]